jgi:hypothetical protein
LWDRVLVHLDGEEMPIFGEVRWVRQVRHGLLYPTGLGVHFLKNDDETARNIESIVKAVTRQ